MALILIIGSAAAWLYYDGRRQWAVVQSDLLARGERLTSAEPVEVADADNFFADSIWTERLPDSGVPESEQQLSVLTPVVDVAALQRRFPGVSMPDGEQLSVGRFALRWIDSKEPGTLPTPTQAEVLYEVLKPMNATLDRIQELAQRPQAIAPWPEEAIQLDSVLLSCGQVFRVRAQVRLAFGDSAGAFADTTTIFALSRYPDSDPTLVQFLMGISLNAIAVDCVRAGLPVWSDEQLAGLQRLLLDANLRTRFQSALRGERVWFNNLMSRINQSPVGIFQLPPAVEPTWEHVVMAIALVPLLPSNAAFSNLHTQAWIDRLSPDAIVSPQVAESVEATLPDMENPWNAFRYSLARLATPSFAGVAMRVANAQAETDMTAIACGIERYHRTFNQLPDALSAMTSEFLPILPRDITNGEPFRYVRESETSYKIWSPGWNQTDEGGKLPEFRRLIDSADWVLQRAAN